MASSMYWDALAEHGLAPIATLMDQHAALTDMSLPCSSMVARVA